MYDSTAYRLQNIFFPPHRICSVPRHDYYTQLLGIKISTENIMKTNQWQSDKELLMCYIGNKEIRHVFGKKIIIHLRAKLTRATKETIQSFNSESKEDKRNSYATNFEQRFRFEQSQRSAVYALKRSPGATSRPMNIQHLFIWWYFTYECWWPTVHSISMKSETPKMPQAC